MFARVAMLALLAVLATLPLSVAQIVATLGEPGASKRAADAILLEAALAKVG